GSHSLASNSFEPHQAHIFFERERPNPGGILNLHDPALEHGGREVIVVDFDNRLANLSQRSGQRVNGERAALDADLRRAGSLENGADGGVQAVLDPKLPLVAQGTRQDLNAGRASFRAQSAKIPIKERRLLDVAE